MFHKDLGPTHWSDGNGIYVFIHSFIHQFTGSFLSANCAVTFLEGSALVLCGSSVLTASVIRGGVESQRHWPCDGVGSRKESR